MTRSPSTSTGTLSCCAKARRSVSVKRQGTLSKSSPLSASAMRMRQQNGLNTRAGSVPHSS